MRTTTIRPGLLVSMKSHVRGGVHHSTKVLEASPEKERRENTTTYDDRAEHKRAKEVRKTAVNLIWRICTPTNFGLICLKSREPELEEARQEARRLVDEFNAEARYTQIRLYVMKGRIADTDEQAAADIVRDVQQLVEDMNEAIDAMDVEEIRRKASEAAQMQELLGEEVSKATGEAVKAARRAARQIVKRVEKEGEAAEVVLKDLQRGAIEKARIAFIDMTDCEPDDAEEAAPVVNQQRFADLDVDGGPKEEVA